MPMPSTTVPTIRSARSGCAPTRAMTTSPTAATARPAPTRRAAGMRRTSSRQQRRDDDRDGLREQPQARLQCGHAEHELQVLRDEQEGTRHHDADQHIDRNRGAERRRAEQPQVDQRVGEPQLTAGEHGADGDPAATESSATGPGSSSARRFTPWITASTATTDSTAPRMSKRPGSGSRTSGSSFSAGIVIGPLAAGVAAAALLVGIGVPGAGPARRHRLRHPRRSRRGRGRGAGGVAAAAPDRRHGVDRVGDRLAGRHGLAARARRRRLGPQAARDLRGAVAAGTDRHVRPGQTRPGPSIRPTASR
jgi:hypothetical protein